MAVYIYKLKEGPAFEWDKDRLAGILSGVRYRQGRLLGRMEGIGPDLQAEAVFQTLIQDVWHTAQIEGGHGAGEGIKQMVGDSTSGYDRQLTVERLSDWYAGLAFSGINRLQAVVLPGSPEKVHYQAPGGYAFSVEMKRFLDWYNAGDSETDPVIKSAIAHLWFMVIHPFDEGNGLIARAIGDGLLCRAEGGNQRFYSLSAQISEERAAYYDQFEKAGNEPREITPWIEWWLGCLDRAIAASFGSLSVILKKASFRERYAGVRFNERQKFMIDKLLEGFTGKLSSSRWARTAGCSSDSAVRDINELLSVGILKKEAAGGRSTGYILA